VTLRVAGMRLDAGGIAKGYAADSALKVLAGAGLRHALVAAGGDIAIGDAPPGEPGWQIALAGLDADRAAPGSPLTLTHAGVSTSGDAEQWVEIAGHRYSHIIDPRTGMALQGHHSVSVVAPDAITSDMLATAVSVLGPAGVALVDGCPGCSALVGAREPAGDAWQHSRRWPARR
jgi:thiamine biosynthesis lipoprotein